MNPSTDLINRLWKLCSLLRKDGITYQQYITELTYLLFLKMLREEKLDKTSIPSGYRWSDLRQAQSSKKLSLYKEILSVLGDPDGGATRAVQAIYFQSATVIRDPSNLDALVEEIDLLDWFSTTRDSLGDLYEGLLQKNAEETKRGAGQYFTPRVLVETIVNLLKPKGGETIQDPAAGTGGFLIAAVRYSRSTTGKEKNDTAGDCRVVGMENVRDTFRLLLMNLQLHRIDSKRVYLGDTLSPDYKKLDLADVVLTNPPFGPAGGRPSRDDLSVTATVSSYQLPFVEHCIRTLKPGGRAAIVVPDNVLFEEGRALALRRLLMDRCNLHTILRLPTGIFYAQGVKTNVLFFERGKTDVGNTAATWIYDSRTGIPQFGKSSPLTLKHFQEFSELYNHPLTRASRDNGSIERFRRFSRDEIATRHDDLDIIWLREDDGAGEESLTEPEDLIAAVAGHLSAALSEIEALTSEMEISEVANIS